MHSYLHNYFDFKLFSYLALQAGMSTGSDAIFIPEDPAPKDWSDILCEKLLQVRLVHFFVFIFGF